MTDVVIRAENFTGRIFERLGIEFINAVAIAENFKYGICDWRQLENFAYQNCVHLREDLRYD